MDIFNSFLTVALPVFIINLISCTAGSLKTSFLLKEAFFLSAVCAAIGAVAMMFTFQQTGPGAYVAVFLAMFIGTYLPPKILKNMEDDCLYVYYVTTPLVEGTKLKTYLGSYDIKVLSTKVYDENNKVALFLTIFSKDKTSSKVIVESINKYKYHRGTPISGEQ